MFMRLIILELDRYSRWIKAIGVLLIGLRFADWPYELAFISIQQAIMAQSPNNGATCWAIWGKGVIILNFVSDSLANLFLSGMFIRRLFVHINHSKTLSSPHSQLIEKIARKSLLCFAFTFVVNLTMNLLKVTMFLGTESDAFTVYFQLIESTLLIEALRNDSVMKAESNALICESCHKELSRSAGQNGFSDDNSDLNNQIIAGTFREHHKIMDQRQDSDIENIKDGSKNYNITPAESAILSQRQPPTEEQPYPSPFPTSLAPRPYTSQSKETSTTSASFINETFLMTNFVKDKSLFPPRITGSENSSSSSHSSRRIDRFNPI
ncbi:hypothetical protein G6F26_010112 [Rhizopus arrhizus]|nr:hypothetical protein G6F21_007931 [Rhizopus arrhizus]KAG0826135.1 hypothetical protein G6F18_010106 [Rhizopus arrhizus]KAG0828191.1 hypothetical protein G6F19_008365 [Rhizopus arrhizus]KAG0850541.1 hypothetical protein G6F17_009786 [Rhizopus arrhizus]KAG1004354.1 hypothetical protein G6F27_010220 [Rhizopus arrhizus]